MSDAIKLIDPLKRTNEMAHRPLLLVIAISFGMLLNPLNSSLISVAMVRIEEVYQLNLATASWIISAFYLSGSIAQPVMGKIADLLGHRKIFLIGLGLVTISSLLAPFSPSFGWLVFFRIIQSIGSSSIYPSGMAMVSQHIKKNQARALALISIFANGTSAIGPALGGFLIGWWNWQSIFAVNFPFIMVSFGLAFWVLPADTISIKQEASVKHGILRSIDVPGMCLFAVSIIGILTLLLSIQTSPNYIFGAAGIIALLLFVRRELKIPHPFIPFLTFAQNRSLLWVNMQFICVHVIFYSIFFGIPIYLQKVGELSESATGLIMLSMVGTLFVAPLASSWIEKSGVRPLLLFSSCLMVLALSFMTLLSKAITIPAIVLTLFVLGISYGLNSVGMQAALFKYSPSEIIGTSSGLFMTSRYLGTIISSLLLGLIFGPALTTERFQMLGMVLVMVSAVTVYLSYLLPKEKFESIELPT